MIIRRNSYKNVYDMAADKCLPYHIYDKILYFIFQPGILFPYDEPGLHAWRLFSWRWYAKGGTVRGIDDADIWIK